MGEEGDLDSIRSMGKVMCDFCSEREAVVYCRADTAKLCLLCDQSVHTANALSRKHVRSKICDSCCSEAATILCSTDGLSLCQECDWDAHGSRSTGASHVRSQVEGFSGCPSPVELASSLGIDLGRKSISSFFKANSASGRSSLDSIVGIDSAFRDLCVPGAAFPTLGKGQPKHALLRQLLELFKSSELGPGTPSLENQPAIREDAYLEHIPFTSLLAIPPSFAINEPRETDQVVQEEDCAWKWGSSTHSSQIWDFHLGKSRDQDETSQPDFAYGTVCGGFVIKNYDGLVKENAFAASNVCCKGKDSTARDDPSASSQNVPHQNAPKDKKWKNGFDGVLEHGRVISSGNVEALVGTSCPYSNGNNEHRNNKYGSQPEPAKLATKPKFDSQLLAQNRGNAMLRYKEKKKTRRTKSEQLEWVIQHVEFHYQSCNFPLYFGRFRIPSSLNYAFEKHIRYESRKARADTRMRVKGICSGCK